MVDQLQMNTSMIEDERPCSGEDCCRWFMLVVYVVIEGTMFVVGFIFNTLSYVVLNTEASTVPILLLKVSSLCLIN